MSNTHKSGTKSLILNLRRSMEAMTARERHLFKTLQLVCEHSEVAEHDRGSNNYSVRICTYCTLKEYAWVDEAGFCNNGYEKLIGTEGRTIKRVSMSEILEYETLTADPVAPAGDRTDQVMQKTLELAQVELSNYKCPAAQENAMRENAAIEQGKADRTK